MFQTPSKEQREKIIQDGFMIAKDQFMNLASKSKIFPSPNLPKQISPLTLVKDQKQIQTSNFILKKLSKDAFNPIEDLLSLKDEDPKIQIPLKRADS